MVFFIERYFGCDWEIFKIFNAFNSYLKEFQLFYTQFTKKFLFLSKEMLESKYKEIYKTTKSSNFLLIINFMFQFIKNIFINLEM